MPYKSEEKKREYSRKYMQEHKAELAAYNLKYRREHPDKVKLWHIRSQQRNPEKHLQYQLTAYANRLRKFGWTVIPPESNN